MLTTAGPLTSAQLSERLALPIDLVEPALQRLHDGCRIIRGPLISGSDDIVAIDPLLDERLLRAQRRARREQHAQPRTPLPLTALPFFLATRHGLVHGSDADQPSVSANDTHQKTIQNAIENTVDPLLGFPAPAAIWEHELLPARSQTYRGGDLDELCAATGPLVWLGCGRQKLTLAVADQLDLIRTQAPATPPGDIAQLIPATGGRYTTSDLISAAGQTGTTDSSAVITKLWTAAWAGIITADGFNLCAVVWPMASAHQQQQRSTSEAVGRHGAPPAQKTASGVDCLSLNRQ